MSEIDWKSYHNYLLQRNRRSLLYRRYYLYPRLSQFLEDRVLEVGCGIGDFLVFRRQTTGVDINPYNINYCRNQGLDAHLIEGERYPFAESTFDGVLIDNVLEHLVDPAPTLSEIQRVLRPGGMLIVGVPGSCGYDRDPDHKHFYDEKLLVTCLEQAGFKTIKIVHMPFRCTFLDRKMRQYCIYCVFQNTKIS